MNLHLKRGYYKDIRSCEEIARGSKLYDHYFSAPGRLETYVKSHFLGDGRGQLYFAETIHGEKAGLMIVDQGGFCNEYHYLALLCVKEKFRSQGVGAWLLSQFERMGREDKKRKASLMVSDFNDRAFEFYKRNGYYEVGMIPNAVVDGISEHFMLKDLC